MAYARKTFPHTWHMSACNYPCLNNGQNSERNIALWRREYNRITTQNQILQDTCLTSCTVRKRESGWRSRYGLDGRGIESRWGDQVFCTRPNRHWGPRSHLYNGWGVSFPGLKRPGRGVDHLSPSSAQIKERVEVSRLPLWTFVACSTVNFTFTLQCAI